MDFSDVLTNFLDLEHVSCVAVYAGLESFHFLMRAGCWLSKVRSQTPTTSQCVEARIGHGRIFAHIWKLSFWNAEENGYFPFYPVVLSNTHNHNTEVFMHGTIKY